MKVKTLLVIGILGTMMMSYQQDNWIPLFNGKDLSGWKQLNGKALYTVENGVLVGTTVANTPNSFLCTENYYGNFILEFEVLDDPALNSGVQIRSQSLEEYRNGRVHGYQVEIDPSPRAFSGGIYDEARRLWLYPMARNQKGSKAFRNGQWNSFHIEAVGNVLRTWVNGVHCANLVDNMTAEGFIGLQVHSISGPEMVGKTVKWKNIRIKTSDLENSLRTPDPEVEETNYIPNTLTEYEKRKGWRLLWDGVSNKGWRSAKSDKFPEKGWKIEDGILSVIGSEGKESSFGGDIITTGKFSNFELIIDFKISEGANSGIKYFVDSDLNKGVGSAIGLEFQILDNKVHPDAKQGIGGNRTLGSLYDLIPAENLSVKGRAVQFNGVGLWNRARIVVNGKRVEHWLNEEKIVAYERGSQIYRALVAKSKYKIWPDFGELPEGHILLQDHGDLVHFRNIKIRDF